MTMKLSDKDWELIVAALEVVGDEDDEWQSEASFALAQRIRKEGLV